MPTVVTKTIAATSSPTTPDYSTLQAWEDAITADLVAADEQWVGECLDQGEFTGSSTLLTISGQTTDATRNIILRCATGDSFSDNVNVRTNALTYNSSNGVAITSSVGYSRTVYVISDYVTLEGLQIKATSGNSQVLRWDTDNGTLSKCILDDNNSVMACSGADALKCSNCLFIKRTTGGSTITCSGGYGTLNEFHGCTLVVPSGVGTGGTAFNNSGGTNPLVKNCAVFGHGTFSNGSFNAGSDYNATDLGTVLGANSLTSLTFADQVENDANDWRAKGTGSLDGAGTPDSTNLPDDISDTARSATAPTIGAWEVVSAAAASVYQALKLFGSSVLSIPNYLLRP